MRGRWGIRLRCEWDLELIASILHVYTDDSCFFQSGGSTVESVGRMPGVREEGGGRTVMIIIILILYTICYGFSFT
jgi:hypothetical protein